MTWIGWLRTKVDRLWTWRRRSALRMALGASHTEQERARRRRTARAYTRQYPAASARVELVLLLEALSARDAVRLRNEVGALRELASLTDDWTDRAAADALGNVIGKLQLHGGNDQLRLALAAFAEFRRQSKESVHEVFPLLEAAAQRGWHDPQTARGYVEYLWSAGESAADGNAHPGRELVQAALQAACQPHQPQAHALNHLVARWLQEPWTHVNLLRWHWHRAEISEAVKHWQVLRSRGQVPADPALLLEAGAMHRRLQQWTEAEWIYGECLRLDPADPQQRQSAEALQLEARLHGLADDLRRGQKLAAPDAWPQLQTAAQALYDARCQAATSTELEDGHREQALEQAQVLFPVLLHFDGFQRHPRATLQRAFFHPGELSLNGHGRCVHHVGRLEPAALQLPAGDLQFHWQYGVALAARGRLGELQKLVELVTATNPGSAQAQLLAAYFALRSGDVAHARAALADLATSTLPREMRLGLEIEIELAQGNFAAAQRHLCEPAAALLPMVERELFSIAALNGDGDWQQAFSRISALLTDTDSPEVLSACGLEGLLVGQDAMAEECFMRALSIDARHHAARLGVWLASAAPPGAEWQDLQREEPLLPALIRAHRTRLWISGRHDLVDRLDNALTTSRN